MVASSTGMYSDAEIHQIRLLFQDRVLEMLIDNTERVTLICKLSVCKYRSVPAIAIHEYIYFYA